MAQLQLHLACLSVSQLVSRFTGCWHNIGIPNPSRVSSTSMFRVYSVGFVVMHPQSRSLQ